jgi:hypothetical protein
LDVSDALIEKETDALVKITVDRLPRAWLTKVVLKPDPTPAQKTAAILFLGPGDTSLTRELATPSAIGWADQIIGGANEVYCYCGSSIARFAGDRLRADQRAQHEPERALTAGDVAKSTGRFWHDGTGSNEAMFDAGQRHQRSQRRQRKGGDRLRRRRE